MARKKKREAIEHIVVWTACIGILPLIWGGGGLVVGMILVGIWILYTINDDLR